MYLNGVVPAKQVSSIPIPNGYNHWTSFTTPPGLIVAGANTVYFVVTNESPVWTYTGLRVEFTNAASCCTCTPPSVVSFSPPGSLPMDATAAITVTAQGTPPFTYQWYHNGVPITNGGHDSGANSPSLKIQPLSAADAGAYYVVISNACGRVTSPSRNLVVSTGGLWPWAMWEFAQPDNPFGATVGPNLILSGTTTTPWPSGTTADFGLPGLGGQVANVMYLPSLAGDTTIHSHRPRGRQLP